MAAPRMSSLAVKWNSSWSKIRLFLNIMRSNQSPGPFAVLGCPSTPVGLGESNHDLPTNSQQEPLFDGFLMAVPKFRRTIERRLKRKHGFTGHFEYAIPKKNIEPCLETGTWKEKGHLSKAWYEKVRAETKEMMAKMGDDLDHIVPQKEITIVYDGETANPKDTYVVKMEKPRPSWFPKKLLNKTGS